MSTLSQFGGNAIKSIQRGTINLSSASSGTATITSVDTAKSELRFLGFGDAGTSPTVRLALTNATTITANAGNTRTDLTVSWELTEFY